MLASFSRNYSKVNATYFERQLQNVPKFIKQFSAWLPAYKLSWKSISVKDFSVLTSLITKLQEIHTLTLQTLDHIRKKNPLHKLDSIITVEKALGTIGDYKTYPLLFDATAEKTTVIWEW